MFQNPWFSDRRTTPFQDNFTLEKHGERETTTVYAVSHSMQRTSSGVVQPYSADTIIPACLIMGDEAKALGVTSLPYFRNFGPSYRLRQTCSLVRDFPSDILVLVFNYVLWSQLIEAGPQEYIARIILPASASQSSTHAPVTLSKTHSPLFLSFVCAYWREVCLSTPTLWSNLYIHAWNRPFPVHHVRPRTKGCGADRARVSLCRLFLARSGSVPLTLTIDANVSNTATVWWDMQLVRVTDERMVLARIFQLCAEHKHRWRKVTVKNLDDRFLLGILFNDHHVGRGGMGDTAMPALEGLSLRLKHVEEDRAPLPRGDPNSTCSAWLELRLHTLVEFVTALPQRCPALRHLELRVDLIDIRLVPGLVTAFETIFAVLPEHDSAGLEERCRRVEAHERFTEWQRTFMKSLIEKGGDEPLYTGSLRKAWFRIVKEGDGIGLKEVDAGVDSLDWDSPLVSL